MATTVPARLRGLQRLLDRIPLRTKLVSASLLLVAVALILSSVAGIAFLRDYLGNRVDAQLELLAERGGPPRRGPGPDMSRGRVDLPSAFVLKYLDADGNTLYDNSWLLREGQQGPKLPARITMPSAPKLFTVPAVSGGGRWRVLIQPGTIGSPSGEQSGSAVVVASLDEIDRTIARLAGTDLVLSVVVLLLMTGAGVAIVRASLRPLVEVEQTAGEIAAGDLSRRVPERDPRTEVGRLGLAFNSMLERIEGAFRAQAASEATARRSEERMRRFVADASHELRTPLTTIRGFAELYRQGASREPAELDRLMRRIEGEAQRMGLLVEDLLLLARLDAQRPLDRRPVDLLALAADAVHDARAVAPDRDVDLVVDGENGAPPVVLGDEPRLRQVIGNLMTNALTHTPAGTPVEVRLRTTVLRGMPRAVVEVADRGPGLTPEQQEHVFERFYRADVARSRRDGSSGLGLAIVAALVAAHDGFVEVDSAPGEGATFRVALPLAPEVAGARLDEPTRTS